MKIVAANFADSLRADGLRPPGSGDRPGTLLLDLVGADLRALYGDAAADLPERLTSLARRLDAARGPEALAA